MKLEDLAFLKNDDSNEPVFSVSVLLNRIKSAGIKTLSEKEMEFLTLNVSKGHILQADAMYHIHNRKSEGKRLVCLKWSCFYNLLNQVLDKKDHINYEMKNNKPGMGLKYCLYGTPFGVHVTLETFFRLVRDIIRYIAKSQDHDIYGLTFEEFKEIGIKDFSAMESLVSPLIIVFDDNRFLRTYEDKSNYLLGNDGNQTTPTIDLRF